MSDPYREPGKQKSTADLMHERTLNARKDRVQKLKDAAPKLLSEVLSKIERIADRGDFELVIETSLTEDGTNFWWTNIFVLEELTRQGFKFSRSRGNGLFIVRVSWGGEIERIPFDGAMSRCANELTASKNVPSPRYHKLPNQD